MLPVRKPICVAFSALFRMSSSWAQFGKGGNLYATLMHIGQVVMLKDGGSYGHIAWVPSKEESGNGDLIGLDLDQAGNIRVVSA